MRDNLKARIQRGELLTGSIMTLPSPEIAEILKQNGFDWIFIDLEHSVMDMKDAMCIMQAVEPNLHCVIRIPALDEVWIKRALDIGAMGIIIPQIQTAEEALRAVRLCKYPPTGIRSVGIARAQGYGMSFADYVAEANEQIAIILQIEHIRGVENIKEILKVDGISAIFVGPYDLSASMDKTGQIDDDVVQNAIAVVTDSARKASVPLGTFCASPEAVKPYIEDGYKLIAVGIDTMIFNNAVKNIPGKINQDPVS